MDLTSIECEIHYIFLEKELKNDTISLLKYKDFNLVGRNEVHTGVNRDSIQI